MPDVNGVANHPAEVGGGVAAAVAVLIAHVFNLTDAGEVTALVVVVGAVPAAITFLVGLFRKRASTPPGP